VQLFRKSMAVRQKEMLQISLRNLEAAVLTAKSASNEEAQLRGKEAELALQYVERAKSLEPLGRVVIGSWSAAQEVILEEGDLIRIPERNSLVTTTGDVVFPNSFAWRAEESVAYYVKLSGGYTQNEKVSRLLVLHQNGVFEDATGGPVNIQAGDEIYVLPKIDSKNLEFARAITTIIYQIAIATGVVVDLFRGNN
ncbi:MAG TPA: polysialic acid transporter, partial [Burkholderiales bacterium]